MLTMNNNLEQLLGIAGWEIKSITLNELEAEVILHLEHEYSAYYQCGCCKERIMFCYDHYSERKVRDLSIFGFRCFLSFSQARVRCPNCKRVCSEYLDWVALYQRQTVRYEKYLASLCDYMPVMDVVDLEGVDKNLLYRIDKKWLQWRNDLYKRDEPVHFLGIDEIAIKRNHKYATVFYDLERSCVIGLVKGRKQRNVSSFFRRWGKDRCLEVKAVCTDLWAAFHNSVKIYLKNATLVFDKFHVYKYLSDAIETVRRTEQNDLDPEKSKLLKGCRWLILKRELRGYKQKQKLTDIISQNENIMKSMLLKESFYSFYAAKNKEQAIMILDEWIMQCKESQLKPFIKLAKRLNRWRVGILNFFTYRISNGVSEGINNKIKVIKRRSYGFHDMNYFFLKILNATGTFPYMREVAHPRKS